MIKKLSRYGNSHALVIDKAIMDLLKIDGQTPLEISTPDGCSLVIKPVRHHQPEKSTAELAMVSSNE
jgi:antitoxin component of MazEF toxin-antitoxin module